MPEFDIWGSAAAQAHALREREISATELLAIYRERIEQYNPMLNAVVVKCFDRAEHRAAEIDPLPKEQVPHPLAGLPMTIKEAVEVSGLVTTGGIVELEGRVSNFDAPNYVSLRDSGMNLMGKTNVPARCADWQSNTPIYGKTNNPWNLDRSPGGSSGGSSTAVAAGLSALEFGTDIGGSIRVPAMFCGIYGLRPSENAIPRYGHMPDSHFPNSAVGMATGGPMARFAEDLDFALDILARPVIGEDVAYSIDIPPARHQSLSGFRVGMLGDLEWVPLAESIRQAQKAVREALQRSGATVIDISPEELLNGSWQHHLDYLKLLTAIMGSGMDREWQEYCLNVLKGRDDIRSAIDESFNGPPTAMIEWHGLRQRQAARYREQFKSIDVLVAPAWPRSAYEHIPHTGRPLIEIFERTLDIDGDEHPQDLGLVYPGISSFAGQPSVAFPVSFDGDGLPVGLQAIGPYLEDRTPIRFAALIAEEIGGFTPPPGYN